MFRIESRVDTKSLEYKENLEAMKRVVDESVGTGLVPVRKADSHPANGGIPTKFLIL